LKAAEESLFIENKFKNSIQYYRNKSWSNWSQQV